jgi:hypothetical protein
MNCIFYSANMFFVFSVNLADNSSENITMFLGGGGGGVATSRSGIGSSRFRFDRFFVLYFIFSYFYNIYFRVNNLCFITTFIAAIRFCHCGLDPQSHTASPLPLLSKHSINFIFNFDMGVYHVKSV